VHFGTAPRPLFSVGTLQALELGPAEVPALQRFFDANPAYFQTIGDQPPGPDEARQEYEDLPPAGMTFSRKWLIGFYDASGADLLGMATVLSDLISPGVWHLGLYIIASSLHGGGQAQALYQALEDWAIAQGAEWMRLGVVQGNTRAERFWCRQAYQPLRLRTGIVMGQRTTSVVVMLKPLRGQILPGPALDAYLNLVPRDRPEAE
jgi:GNAT superfamily N-acetyltransferase